MFSTRGKGLTTNRMPKVRKAAALIDDLRLALKRAEVAESRSSCSRSRKQHINTRTSHPVPKAQYKGDTRSHVFVGSLCLCGPLGTCVSLGPLVGVVKGHMNTGSSSHK